VDKNSLFWNWYDKIVATATAAAIIRKM